MGAGREKIPRLAQRHLSSNRQFRTPFDRVRRRPRPRRMAMRCHADHCDAAVGIEDGTWPIFLFFRFRLPRSNRRFLQWIDGSLNKFHCRQDSNSEHMVFARCRSLRRHDRSSQFLAGARRMAPERHGRRLAVNGMRLTYPPDERFRFHFPSVRIEVRAVLTQQFNNEAFPFTVR